MTYPVQVQQQPSPPTRKFSPPNSYQGKSPPKIYTSPQQNTQPTVSAFTRDQVAQKQEQTICGIIKIMKKHINAELESHPQFTLNLKLKKKGKKKVEVPASKKQQKACQVFTKKYKNIPGAKLFVDPNYKLQSKYGLIKLESLRQRFNIQGDLKELDGGGVMAYNFLIKKVSEWVNIGRGDSLIIKNFLHQVEGIEIYVDSKKSLRIDCSKSIYLQKVCNSAAFALQNYAYTKTERKWWL